MKKFEVRKELADFLKVFNEVTVPSLLANGFKPTPINAREGLANLTSSLTTKGPKIAKILDDIIDCLIKPNRSIRDQYQTPLLKKDILHIEDLKPGMVLEGTVRNVVDFGAFIDIGLKNDGLVHISKMSKQRIKHPLDVLSIGDIVEVNVIDVDLKKNRVSLSMI